MDNYKLQHMEIDLDKPISEKNVGMVMGSGDENANTFTVSVKRGGETVDLSGCTVTGYLIMPNDETLRITGSVNDGKASVTVPKSGYVYDGAFQLAIKIVVSGKENTVAIFTGQNARTTTENISDGQRVVYGVKDILNMIDSMEQTETNAKSATTAANNAAASANSAAQSANTIAQTVENKLDAGDFKGEKGDTGATPNITFHVATGEPGSQVQISQSGTAENPVVDLTIPRGDTGAVEGLDYFAGSPSALGTASPGTANGVARGDHVHPMPTADDVGALPVGGTASNASKLGGKSPEYYLQPVNLFDNSNFQIAQAGYNGLHGTETYVADRWRGINVTGELTTDGFRLTGSAVNSYIFQRVTGLQGKKLTFAVKFSGAPTALIRVAAPDVGTVLAEAQNPDSDGILLITFNATTDMLAFMIFPYSDGVSSSGTGTIEWAALYEGEYTAETLPPYVPKGYAAELLECQRYYYRMSANNQAFIATGVSNVEAVFAPIILPVPLYGNIIPTIESANVDIYPYVTGGSVAVLSIAVYYITLSRNVVTLKLEHATNALAAKAAGAVRLKDNGYLAFSCDL